MRLFLAVLCAALMSGCASARFGGAVLSGPCGPEGAMMTLRVGSQPCAAEPVPAGDPANPPGTAVGRAMVRAADWSTEHPVWASIIAAGTAALASGAATDWWGLADDGGGDKPKADASPAPASDREIDARIAGSGNAVNVSYTYLPGGGKMPNVAADIAGDNNRLNIDVKPME